jgi:hypothetical protein
MLRIILAVYIFILLLMSMGYNIFFINEEFIVSFSLILFFFLLYFLLRKIIVKLIFFKIDHIYFSFLYLINLTIILAKKIKNLLSIFDARSNLIVLDFCINFFDVINMNLYYLKNILAINFLNNMFLNLYSNLKFKIVFLSSFKKHNKYLNLLLYASNFNKFIINK